MWFVFALSSAVFTGMQSFMNKVAVERKYDSYHVNFIAAATTCFLALLIFLFSSASFAGAPAMLYWLGIISAILYIGRTLTQLESLRFIDAALFFPLYKVIGPALVTLIGLFFLRDVLTPAELIGIALSCAVPLLLITHAEHKRQNNLWLGIALMFTSTALAAVVAAVNAYAVKPSADLAIPFMVVAYGVGMVVAGFWYVQHHKLQGIHRTFKDHSTPAALFIGAAIGVFQIISFYLILLGFAAGDLSVVYSINAHYILIPVLLSVWFYREHWNTQKAVALVISVLALILLHE